MKRRATLSVRDSKTAPDSPEATVSEFVLWQNGTAQFFPNDDQQRKLTHFFAHLNEQALKWGASLVVGLAVAGGICWYRGRRGAGAALLGASGLSGVGANALRRAARYYGNALTEPFPAGELTAAIDPDTGELCLTRRSPSPIGASRYTVKLPPGEFDPDEAAAFVAALEK